jgi:hypothetical protein
MSLPKQDGILHNEPSCAEEIKLVGNLVFVGCCTEELSTLWMTSCTMVRGGDVCKNQSQLVDIACRYVTQLRARCMPPSYLDGILHKGDTGGGH